MKSLIKRYKIEFGAEEEEVRPAATNGGCEDRLVEALLLATGKKPAAMEHVNIAAELAKLGLDASSRSQYGPLQMLYESWPQR
jgi:hypothetical protein